MFLKLTAYLSIVLLPLFGFAAPGTDSLLNEWRKAKNKPNYATNPNNIALLNQLMVDYRNNSTDSSLLFGRQALEIAKRTNNHEGQAKSLSNLGFTYYVQGAYFPALEVATQLMDLSAKTNYRPGIANAYHIRGLVYMLQDEFEPSIIESTKALKVFQQLGNKAKIARMYFNIAICYDEEHKPHLAFKYLDLALKTAQSINDTHVISMIYNRLGELHFHIKNYRQAILYHQMVLNSAYQDTWENAFAYSGLAQAYYALKEYDKALQYAQASVKNSREVHSLWDEVRGLKILSKAYAAKGNYKLAYDNNVLMQHYNDSIFNDNKQKQLNYLQLRQQRSDNLRLEKENQVHQEQSKFNRLLLAGIGVLAFCLAIFAVFISRSNVHKTALNKKLERRNQAIDIQKEEISMQNKKLDQLNHTKDLLFSVISHDLRGPFASMLQTLELIRSGDISQKELDIIMENFQQQVSHINIMVNNLLLWANSQLSGITSKAVELDATVITDEIFSVSNFLAGNKNIKLVHLHTSPKPVFADADHLKIILQNVIGNAIKFTPQGGMVTVSYSEQDGSQVICVKDNGIGITPEKMHQLFKVVGKGISGYGTEKEIGAGIGLLLIKQFAEVNNGRLEISSQPGEGTEVRIHLPLPPASQQAEVTN